MCGSVRSCSRRTSWKASPPALSACSAPPAWITARPRRPSPPSRNSSDASSRDETRMNYYELLGVSSDATDDEIKKAFRALARKCHPDANPDDPTAVERFKEINEAYDTLGHHARRRRCALFGPQGANAGGFGGGSQFDAGAVGLNDLFDAFFGGAGPRGRGPRGAAPGPHAAT